MYEHRVITALRDYRSSQKDRKKSQPQANYALSSSPNLRAAGTSGVPAGADDTSSFPH